jgi:hypothetical protein
MVIKFDVVVALQAHPLPAVTPKPPLWDVASKLAFP